MPNCSPLSTVTSSTQFITKDNVYELVTSTDSLTPGTSVQLSCQDGLQLNGPSTVTCQNDGTWSFTSTPTCQIGSATPTESDGLDNETVIMIAVVASVAGVIVIALLLMCCYVWNRDKQRKARDMDYIQRSDPSYIDRPRHGLATVQEVEMYGHGPPPYYGRHSMPDRSLERPYNERDQRFSPRMYLPRDQRGDYSSYYGDMKRSRNKRKQYLDEAYSDRDQKPRPNVHGPHGPGYGGSGRDPYLWRNAH